MVKRQFHIFPILLALVMAFSCLFAVPATAAAAETDVNVLNIEDYVSKKQFVGNDVIVTYDLPLEPVGEFVMTEGDASFSTVCDGQYITWALMQEAGTTEVISYKQFTRYSTPAASVYVNTSSSVLGADFVVYGRYCASFSTFNAYEYYWDVLEEKLTYFLIDTNYFYLQNYITGTWVDGTEIVPYKLFDFGRCSFFFTPSTCYLLSNYKMGNVAFSVGTHTVQTVPNYTWDSMQSSFTPLGYADDGNTIRNVINIDDFRTGAMFSVQFEYSCDLFLEGKIGDAASMFEVHYLSKDLEYVGTAKNQFIVTDVGEYYTYTVSCELTVPEDAAYFYISYDTGQFDVKDASFFAWSFYDLRMISTLSALQDTSNTMDRVTKKLQNLENKVDDLQQGIEDTNNKLDDIISGGEAGDQLGEAGDQLDQGNSELDNVMGELDNASGLLPDMPDDLQDVLGGNMGTIDNSNLAMLMPWNDEQYSEFWNAMFTPTLAAVSIALLLYFVFGKARS